MKKVQVIKSYISIGNYNEFIKKLLNLSEIKKSSYVCVSNVHMTIEANDNKKFLDVVNNADMTTPDGMPIAKAIKYLYGIDQDRVAGMDLMPSLIEECAKQNKSIYLYGSTDDVLEKIIKKVKNNFESLKIDAYSPPFRELSQNEEDAIIHTVNDGKYDFVFVALGCPKQEKWMAKHKGKINSCMIGLGGAFEVYADVKDRAPQWIQENSLEWVYRLLQDPKRLWKRYLYTNNKYILLFVKQYMKHKFLKKGTNE